MTVASVLASMNRNVALPIRCETKVVSATPIVIATEELLNIVRNSEVRLGVISRNTSGASTCGLV